MLPSGVYSQKPCILQWNVPPIYKCMRSELTLFRTTFSLNGAHKFMRTWWTLKQQESVYTPVQGACSWPSRSHKQLHVVSCLHSSSVHVNVFFFSPSLSLSISLPLPLYVSQCDQVQVIPIPSVCISYSLCQFACACSWHEAFLCLSFFFLSSLL